MYEVLIKTWGRRLVNACQNFHQGKSFAKTDVVKEKFWENRSLKLLPVIVVNCDIPK